MVIGQGNSIVRTTNGGIDWSFVYPASGTIDTNLFGYDIELATGGEGLAIGADDLMVRSTDHGATWMAPTTSPVLPTGSSVWTAVDVVTVVGGGGSIANAFVCGTDGFFANSTDGGDNWTTISDPNLSGVNWRGVDFTAGGINTVGYIVGDGGAALRSTDGGATWTPMSFRSTPSPLPNFRAVATHGLGDDAVLVGDDNAVYVRNNVGQLVQQNLGVLLTDPIDPLIDFLGVDITDSGSTWIIVGQRGTVVRSDSGSWSTPKSKTDTLLRSASFLSGTNGFIIGQQFYIGRWN
ncbi:MAG: YCF48-related protein [Planctomycetota bacterium]